MKPLTCAKTRRRIHAFHDGELSVPEQIAVASHLEWCDECAAAFEDMQNVRAVLRSVLPGRTALSPDEQHIFPAAVVNRMKAERSASWPVRLQLMFEDAHLVYAGAAAAFAALVCVVVMLGMMRFATSTPRPDSLAALLNVLTPGSNQNPVVPRASVQMPKPLDQAFSTSSGVTGDEDAVFTLAAVVTREGRVANLELLRETGDDVVPGTDEAKVVANLLDAVSRARFEPGSVAGLPVAVNMVWLVAHTTVRGTVAVAPERPAEPPVKKRRIRSLGEPLHTARTVA
jgi:Putative zinc-finger